MTHPSDPHTPAAQLRQELREHLPPFAICRRCGKPIWGVESMVHGIGPRCAMLEALDNLADTVRRESETP